MIESLSSWFARFMDDMKFVMIEGDRYMMILNGLATTVQITVFAVLLGVVLGTLIALMRLSRLKLIRGVASLYVTVIRGTPVVAQLFIIYFVILASYPGSKVVVAIIAFGINSAAYVSEMIRAAILAIDKGQTEAGRSLGLSGASTMLLIVMPQAAKIALPSLFNEVIMLFKETSVVGMMGLMDIMKAGDFIRSRTYNATIPLLTVAAIYLVCVILMTFVFGKIEGRLRKSDRR